jgi:eukaryotic-like serine/threonine-protein kinase
MPMVRKDADGYKWEPMGAHAEPRTHVPAGLALPERYRPLRLIASGGTAQVWCAEDRSLTRRVAVKLLAEPYASDPAAVRRFAREARAAAHLSAHPHVVTIYDVGETRPQDGSASLPFIVMEHLPGGTVADAVRVGELTPDDAVRWCHEAASALDYAHAQGIVHRDIKPANLLLDRHRSLHVADFGIAQIGRHDSLTIAGQVLGTASYLAPERAIGRPATVASDLYSLAVTVFELLVGERPFSASSYIAQARQHLEDEPPRPSDINPRLPLVLDAVMARGMAKAPEQRWPSAQAFADAVSNALAPASAPRSDRAAAVSRGRRAAAAASAARPGVITGRPVSARPVSVTARPIAATPRPASATARPGAVGADALAAPFPVNRRRPAIPVQARRPTPPAAAIRDDHRRRVAPLPLAGAILSLAAVVVGVVWILAGSAAPPTTVHASAAPSAPAPAVTHPASRPHRRAARPAHKPAARPVVETVAAPPAPPSAQTLEVQGHALLYGGQAGAAIPVLRRAFAAASPGSLTYAYAMFDLAHALRLSGDPRAAVPLLVARLKIPNQTDKVKAELVLALHALARQTGASPSAGAPPDRAKPAPGRRDRGRDHHGRDQIAPGAARA